MGRSREAHLDISVDHGVRVHVVQAAQYIQRHCGHHFLFQPLPTTIALLIMTLYTVPANHK